MTRTGHTCLTFAASAETRGRLLVFAAGTITRRRHSDSQGARVTGADPSEQLIVALHSHVGALSNIGKAAPARRAHPSARRSCRPGASSNPPRAPASGLDHPPSRYAHT